MAQGKKSFKMYVDQRVFFDELPDELAGKVIKYLFSYVSDEDIPEDDLLLKIAFAPIKRQLKHDLKKYEETVARNKKNGALGGRPKTQVNPKNPVGYSGLNKNPNKPDKDKDKDIEDIYIYSENDFLENWGLCRKHYLKKPTHIKKLTSWDRTNLKTALKDFSKEDINKAMLGLFKQKNITISAMLLQPKHFLENIDKYYQAELSGEYTLYGQGKVKTEL